jgi:hypothetical protein
MILSADILAARYLLCRYDLLELGLLISGASVGNLALRLGALDSNRRPQIVAFTFLRSLEVMQ